LLFEAPMKKYDAIIIGSGQAGTPLAFKLASKKMKVAFIEKEHFGGTCLNVGCTPTKTYVASARRMYDAQNGEALGISIPEGARADLSRIKKRKGDIINKSLNGLTQALENHRNIDVFRGTASFKSSKTVVIDGEEIEGDKIFINVGSRARVPSGFEGVDFLTNQELLQLEEIPEHLIVVGGSYIGLEFAQIFRRFGAKVTVVEMHGRLISREDEEVSDTIREILEGEGIQFRLNATCLSGTQDQSGKITVNLDCIEGSPKIIGSHLLLAVGRVPNSDTLNLKATGLIEDERGFIEDKDYLDYCNY
jgi:pyruvate/2-oxoglutarate dehydrogenase complex dihydrolipoamide dehydrogenase (E3) component